MGSDYGVPTANDLDRSITKYKWWLIPTQVILLILNVVVFFICGWVRFDLDMSGWAPALEWYTFWHCTYVNMVAAIFAVATSVICLYGLFYVGGVSSTTCTLFVLLYHQQDRAGIIGVVQIATVILGLIQFVGSTLILIYGVEESSTLVSELQDVFLKLVYEYDNDKNARALLQQIMEYVGCCGSNGVEDFINNGKPVPVECRDLITGNEYPNGCKQEFAWWIEPWAANIAGINMGIIIFDIIDFVLLHKLRRAINAYYDNYGEVYE